ncbi:protein rep, partial [Vibrio parahaemolyticus]|nr:protein rep [Vibrio parahaemolyticus]
TLTVPNVPAERLGDEIKHLHQSWDRMSRRAFFKKSIKGWFRALEVTYNGQRDDYHPHIHVLLCVPSGYFKKNYINRDQWLEYWQEATRYPHVTQVDVRTIRPNKKRPESDAITSAAAEVGKYATKPSNYVCKSPTGQYFAVHKVVRELAEGIARKRMIAFGGIMKDYHLKLQQQDVDSDSVDLIHVEGEATAIDAVAVHIFRWNVGLNNYFC